MSKQTLHLCNYSAISDFVDYFNLVAKEDAIIFYGETLSAEDYYNLSNNDLISDKLLYFIIDNNTHKLPTINYSDWVDLVDAYKRTLTWK